MDGSTENKGWAAGVTILLLTVILVAIIPVDAAWTYDEVVSVSCYEGNPEDGSCIGTLTVPFPENSAQGCNSMYSDCKGKCVGCVSDFDITENVCYDSTGRKFLK